MGVLSTLNVLNDPNAPQAIDSNALNVTRVGGLAAAITSIGAAATGVFSGLNTDELGLKIAITGATGGIVVAGVLAAALIIAADVRARATAECCKTGGTEAVAGTPDAAAATPDAAAVSKQYIEDVRRALDEVEVLGDDIPDTADAATLRGLALLYDGLSRTLGDLKPPPDFTVHHNRSVAEADALSKEATVFAEQSERPSAAIRGLGHRIQAFRGSLRSAVAGLRS